MIKTREYNNLREIARSDSKSDKVQEQEGHAIFSLRMGTERLPLRRAWSGNGVRWAYAKRTRRNSGRTSSEGLLILQGRSWKNAASNERE